MAHMLPEEEALGSSLGGPEPAAAAAQRPNGAGVEAGELNGDFCFWDHSGEPTQVRGGRGWVGGWVGGCWSRGAGWGAQGLERAGAEGRRGGGGKRAGMEGVAGGRREGRGAARVVCGVRSCVAAGRGGPRVFACRECRRTHAHAHSRRNGT